MDWIKSLAMAPLDELHQTELVRPQQANHYGTLFGPEALALLGKTAYLAAARFCEQPVVMAAAKGISFLAPAPVGALLHLHARVCGLGRSSMTVEVRALLDAAPGTLGTEVLRASFVMVAVDHHGRSTAASPRQRARSPAPSSEDIDTSLQAAPAAGR